MKELKLYRIYNRATQQYIHAGSSFRTFWQKKHVAVQHCHGMRHNDVLEIHTFKLVRTVDE